jgi:hypothetical protein
MPSLKFRGRYPDVIARELDGILAAVNPFLTLEQTSEETVELSSSTSLVIPDNTVTYPQMQNVSAASRLLGRGSSGSGDVEELELGTSLAMTGTTVDIASFAAGSWTPTDASGAGLSFANVEASYVRLGPLVVAVGTVTYPSTVDGSAAVLGGLPVTSQNTTRRLATGLVATDAGASVAYQVNVNATTARLVSPTALSTIANSTLSTRVLSFSLIYRA